jgi:ABC-type multidrug transport system ATPase subunit
MIELLGLHKTYGTRAVLSNASLTVRGGESIALVGSNGSGKTTTLRCAVGLARPSSGRIVIDGIDMASHPCEARARLSYLAQRTDFPATLTVREILTVVANLRGAPSSAVEREVSLCGLTPLAGRTVGHLSGGERQRIAIAALFIPEATAYLLDEPTMNLDPIGVRLLVERLAGARDEGRAVLFTTHATAELDDLTTGVAVLSDGHIVAVAQQVEPGERHFSIALDGGAEPWVDTALRGGARSAWPGRGRLHVIVPDGAVSLLLIRLRYEGARVSSYRSESALAAALERLDEEVHHDEVARAHSVDRCVATGQLWRGAAWARADSAGPR